MGRLKRNNELGNVIQGNAVTEETKNTIILGEDKLIAAVGLENIIIVDSEDAILICQQEHTGRIKKVLEDLRICNKTEYL